MKPKEKAEKLISKFMYITPANYNLNDTPKQVNSENYRDFLLCKKCALICVNEILESVKRCNFKAEEIYRFWEDVKQEIETKKDCKVIVTREDDKLVIEYEEKEKTPEFKDGDFITTENDKNGIFKEIENRALYCYYPYSSGSSFKMPNENLRLMTKEEIKTFLEKKNKEGIDWDSENKKWIKYEWKPTEGEVIYFANPSMIEGYDTITYHNSMNDILMLSRHMMFRTKEGAISCTKKMLNAIKPKA